MSISQIHFSDLRSPSFPLHVPPSSFPPSTPPPIHRSPTMHRILRVVVAFRILATMH